VRKNPVLLAILGGVVLYGLLLFITGRLAAIAWPPWFADFARTHGGFARVLSDTVLFVVPVVVITFFFGVLLAGWGWFVRMNRYAEELEPEAMQEAKREDRKLK
jgi:hypothetical protein